jgi:hypothetical protein
VQPVYDALRGIPKFKGLEQPPKVGQMTNSPTAPPATASTQPTGRR